MAAAWDNTALFADDNPADEAFRQEVRQWVEANCPPELRNRPSRVTPPEVRPWHRKLYERGWIAPHWPKEVGGMGATLTHEPFDLPAQGVKVCFVDTPGEDGTTGTQIELIEPLGENSPIHGFIAKNPAGGQHHMCYEVADIYEAKAWFESLGKKVLGEPRVGAHGTLIFFVHPKDMNGVLTEIMETQKRDVAQ